MTYEVDILAVGDASHSGDAIAFRFGNYLQNPQDQKVVVIDGGFQSSGEELVNRIRQHYNTECVDLVISTHPDNDHVSGLHVVLDELEVAELWMHRPWNLSESVKKLAEDRRISLLLPPSKLKKSLESAYDLEKLANKKGIPILEPFQGHSAFDGILHVLGPSQSLYAQLVTEFQKSGTVFSVQKVKSLVSELWHQDELVEPVADAVSARNNSSVVLLAVLGNDHFLFTGDSGVLGLTHAADYAMASGYDIGQRVRYFQVPHHGSKRNLGPSLLNRIIGPIVPQGQKIGKTAFISAAPEGQPHHPSMRVTNAMNRRGVSVMATRGAHHYIRSLDMAPRVDWGPIVPVDFVHSYDEED